MLGLIMGPNRTARAPMLVTDIDAAVDQLIAAGVTFEHYGEGFDQDERGIARGQHGPPIAWLRDLAGNILSVIQTD